MRIGGEREEDEVEYFRKDLEMNNFFLSLKYTLSSTLK